MWAAELGVRSWSGKKDFLTLGDGDGAIIMLGEVLNVRPLFFGDFSTPLNTAIGPYVCYGKVIVASVKP